jgi:hypothetical protein
MLQTKFLEKIKTLFMFSNFFPENRACCEIMWKNNGGAGEATDDYVTLAHCMLDN